MAIRPLLVRGGTLVTMGPLGVFDADLLIVSGRIVAIGQGLPCPAQTQVVDAQSRVVLPGLIQGHVHLGQTLFAGLAEGRPLMPWLRDRIWPLEAAHDRKTAYTSTMLGAVQCLRSGTTTVQDIGLATQMSAMFEAVAASGLRAVLGKCLMDTGEGVPSSLLASTRAVLAETDALHRVWHGACDGRIAYALCPRFILSCTRELWEGVVDMARRSSLPVHTHLLEHEKEEREVRMQRGQGQMAFLDQLGVLDTDLRIAHGVQFGVEQRSVLAGRTLSVVHCPSANLKLGSGIADLGFLGATPGVRLGIGCDGCACNNTLDVLQEIRLAALLQAHRQGPGNFSAQQAIALATCEGARALGLEDEIGSLEVGKAGDVVVLDLEQPWSLGASETSVYDRIVYGAGRDAVRDVVIEGRVRVRNGALTDLDETEIVAYAREAFSRIVPQIGAM